MHPVYIQKVMIVVRILEDVLLMTRVVNVWRVSFCQIQGLVFSAFKAFSVLVLGRIVNEDTADLKPATITVGPRYPVTPVFCQ